MEEYREGTHQKCLKYDYSPITHYTNTYTSIWLKNVTVLNKNGVTKVMPPILFLRIYSYNYNDIYIHQWYNVTQLKSVFHKVSFIINTVQAVGQSHKTLCCSIGALHTRRVSARCLQNGIKSASFRGQKDGSWRVLNGDCRDDEYTPLL